MPKSSKSLSKKPKPTKTAFITGITGQDGSYLSELLLRKHYRVVGLVRRSARTELQNIRHLVHDLRLVYGDMADGGVLASILAEHQPDEIYNLAAQSSPADSWKQPVYTADITGVGAARLFETARSIVPQARIYQASTSEMFGDTTQVPQNEHTPFQANNPYGIAKLYAHQMARLHRQAYGQFVACGILFNHESPRRGPHFITRKIAIGAACIKLSVQYPPLNEKGQPLINQNGKLPIGNLEGQRDWGYAKDYVQAMWQMLQLDHADDFVIATGELHTVKDLCQATFSHVNLDWQDYIEVDPDFIRPQETGPLVGDSSKAKKVLGWQPQTKFKKLIGLMVDHELARLR
jgi:GDPmannose 4,6-dehydratase